MADLPESNHSAHRLDDIVRGLPARLVNHKDSVNGRRLCFSWHFAS
jgi:hypothetical protein